MIDEMYVPPQERKVKEIVITLIAVLFAFATELATYQAGVRYGRMSKAAATLAVMVYDTGFHEGMSRGKELAIVPGSVELSVK